MAGRRVYGGSNMVVILQNEGFSPEAIEALLASGASAGFHGSRSVVNFEDIKGSTGEHSLYHQAELEETGFDDTTDECFHQSEKKRRLTADQVQFLERNFEMENKLEPERKVQLAKDLGLQPRQVAIWFQNRRARWKTKQLEKDYEALKSSFNELEAEYENSLKDKEKLKAEVALLTEKLLLREKGRKESETLGPGSPVLQHQVRKAYPDATLGAKMPDVPIPICKQEDNSSANSAVLDLDSPRCSDGEHSPILEPVDSSNPFEQENSDVSHVEEEEEMYHFPKIEDNSGNYGFAVEDQAFSWFWPCY